MENFKSFLVCLELDQSTLKSLIEHSSKTSPPLALAHLVDLVISEVVPQHSLARMRSKISTMELLRSFSDPNDLFNSIMRTPAFFEQLKSLSGKAMSLNKLDVALVLIEILFNFYQSAHFQKANPFGFFVNLANTIMSLGSFEKKTEFLKSSVFLKIMRMRDQDSQKYFSHISPQIKCLFHVLCPNETENKKETYSLERIKCLESLVSLVISLHLQLDFLELTLPLAKFLLSDFLFQQIDLEIAKEVQKTFSRFPLNFSAHNLHFSGIFAEKEVYKAMLRLVSFPFITKFKTAEDIEKTTSKKLDIQSFLNFTDRIIGIQEFFNFFIEDFKTKIDDSPECFAQMMMISQAGELIVEDHEEVIEEFLRLAEAINYSQFKGNSLLIPFGVCHVLGQWASDIPENISNENSKRAFLLLEKIIEMDLAPLVTKHAFSGLINLFSDRRFSERSLVSAFCEKILKSVISKEVKLKKVKILCLSAICERGFTQNSSLPDALGNSCAQIVSAVLPGIQDAGVSFEKSGAAIELLTLLLGNFQNELRVYGPIVMNACYGRAVRVVSEKKSSSFFLYFFHGTCRLSACKEIRDWLRNFIPVLSNLIVWRLKHLVSLKMEELEQEELDNLNEESDQLFELLIRVASIFMNELAPMLFLIYDHISQYVYTRRNQRLFGLLNELVLCFIKFLEKTDLFNKKSLSNRILSKDISGTVNFYPEANLELRGTFISNLEETIIAMDDQLDQNTTKAVLKILQKEVFASFKAESFLFDEPSATQPTNSIGSPNQSLRTEEENKEASEGAMEVEATKLVLPLESKNKKEKQLREDPSQFGLKSFPDFLQIARSLDVYWETEADEMEEETIENFEEEDSEPFQEVISIKEFAKSIRKACSSVMEPLSELYPSLLRPLIERIFENRSFVTHAKSTRKTIDKKSFIFFCQAYMKSVPDNEARVNIFLETREIIHQILQGNQSGFDLKLSVVYLLGEMALLHPSSIKNDFQSIKDLLVAESRNTHYEKYLKENIVSALLKVLRAFGYRIIGAETALISCLAKLPLKSDYFENKKTIKSLIGLLPSFPHVLSSKNEEFNKFIKKFKDLLNEDPRLERCLDAFDELVRMSK